MDLGPYRCAPRPVLYVEDNEINAMLMGAVFDRRPGLHLLVAGTGQQALRIAQAVPPILLLVDLRLPDCHGMQLLTLLRQLPGCETIPAVAVTAEDDVVIAGTSFTEVWSKPLDLPTVFARLDHLTSEVRTARSASSQGSQVARSLIGPTAPFTAQWEDADCNAD